LQLVWKAGFFDITGYGTAARGYILSLDRMGVNLRVIVDGRGSPGRIPMEARESILRLAARPAEKPSETAFIKQSIPDRFEKMGSFSMGITAWETGRIHRLWRDWSNAMDAVGVPSRMNVEAFTGSGVHKPVVHLRYGVDRAFAGPGKHRDPFAGKSMPPFKFLSVFDWIYRKGYDLLIRAFWEEFSARDGVCLVIKTGHGRTPRRLRESIDGEMRILKETLKPRRGTAPIFFLTGEAPAERMVDLYRACHCFVLPSRGEGAGLPLLEAGSLGMPVISTGWGGQTDFLNTANSFPVEYRLVPVPAHGDCPYYQPDQQWAQPSVADLRKKMRWVLENYDQSLVKGRELRKLVLSRYTCDNAAHDVVEVVRRLTGREIV
jgi:glycosyltransferase involved in cell wall biosynthesis